MNAQQIRDALKPMTQFAPALVRAAEIVDAAEQAEKQLANFEKAKAKLESEVAALEARKDEFSGRITAEKTKFTNFVDQQEKAKQAVKDDVSKALAELNKVQAQIAALNEEYDQKRKEKEAELSQLEKGRAAIRAEIENFKKRMAAVG